LGSLIDGSKRWVIMSFRRLGSSYIRDILDRSIRWGDVLWYDMMWYIWWLVIIIYIDCDNGWSDEWRTAYFGVDLVDGVEWTDILVVGGLAVLEG